MSRYLKTQGQLTPVSLDLSREIQSWNYAGRQAPPSTLEGTAFESNDTAGYFFVIKKAVMPSRDDCFIEYFGLIGENNLSAGSADLRQIIALEGNPWYLFTGRTGPLSEQGSTKQNGDQEMTISNSSHSVSPSPELPHVPEDWVIASFGCDEENPERTVFLKNPDLLDAFINSSEKETGSDNFPGGVLGYVKDSDGSIVVLLSPNEPVNQTVVNEIYSQISVRGRSFNVTNVPCKFIRMDVVHVEVPKDTMP
ncbi:MAG: hypothetical protein M0R30_13185, partial [Methanoregula sp.]|uniref:hypothetical protein n=1 Tax=Methanoregula sp. TaxID=2052170 RepID=UPI0025D18CFC